MNSSPSAPAKSKQAASKSSDPRRSTKAAGPSQDATQLQPNKATRQVSFELEAGAAREVLLAGDFTGWEKTPIKLRKSERGTWQTSVTLAPGEYHYRFLVDGKWCDDPRARRTQPNPFGSQDCILEIS